MATKKTAETDEVTVPVDPDATGDYLSHVQLTKLSEPIDSQRVKILETNGKAFIKGADDRRHLTRIFGFARWEEQQPAGPPRCIIDETIKAEPPMQHDRFTVVYMATVRLIVKSPSGLVLATIDASASASQQKVSNRADAHEVAIKAAQTNALKRAAINLGDQFGLGLYDESIGAGQSYVGKSLVSPDFDAAAYIAAVGAKKASNGTAAATATGTPAESTPAAPAPDPDALACGCAKSMFALSGGHYSATCALIADGKVTKVVAKIAGSK